MASIATRTNGHREVQFRHADNTRAVVRLGKVSKAAAATVLAHVQHLLAAARTGSPPPSATLAWLADLPPELHAKLTRAGLVAARPNARTVHGWLDELLAEKDRDLKPSAARKLRQTAEKLRAFTDARTPLRALTPEHAAAWRRGLTDAGLSVASVRTHTGNAKSIMAEAVRRKLIDADPFARLSAGSTASAQRRYVTPTEAAAVLDELPDLPMRLLFALGFWAGLRVPSEPAALTWADVDLHRGLLHVRSVKTERHAGHDRRTVPMAPPLAALLLEAFDAAEPGVDAVLPVVPNKRRQYDGIAAACRRAGVEPWRPLWQTLRSTAARRFAAELPQYAVGKIMGQGLRVGIEHYQHTVPAELLTRITGVTAAPDNAPNKPATQGAAKSAAAPVCTPLHGPANGGNEKAPTAANPHLQAVGAFLGDGGGGNRTPVPG